MIHDIRALDVPDALTHDGVAFQIATDFATPRFFVYRTSPDLVSLDRVAPRS